jgi:hypothetical protein
MTYKGALKFGVKSSFTKNFITARYSILSILSDTDNTSASDSCIKQTTWYNDLQFHMDGYDRCTNLKKNLADSVAIYGRGRELFRPPMYCTLDLIVTWNVIQNI